MNFNESEPLSTLYQASSLDGTDRVQTVCYLMFECSADVVRRSLLLVLVLASLSCGYALPVSNELAVKWVMHTSFILQVLSWHIHSLIQLISFLSFDSVRALKSLNPRKITELAVPLSPA